MKKAFLYPVLLLSAFFVSCTIPASSVSLPASSALEAPPAPAAASHSEPSPAQQEENNEYFDLAKVTERYNAEVTGYEQLIEDVYPLIVYLSKEATGPEEIYQQYSDAVLEYCIRLRQQIILGPVYDLSTVEDYITPFADIESLSEIIVGTPYTRQLMETAVYAEHFDPMADTIALYIYWGTHHFAHIIEVKEDAEGPCIAAELTFWDVYTGETSTLGFYEITFAPVSSPLWGDLWQLKSVQEIPQP